MKSKDRISEATHYEVYFDLWGFSPRWIVAIQDALHNFSQPSLGDDGESSFCEANASYRFTSTDKCRTEKAKGLFMRLEALARKTEKPQDEIHYYRNIG